MDGAGIIVAAGRGLRMGFDKLLAPLGGKPVLQWSLDAFLRAQSIESVVVVTSEERFEKLNHGSGKPVIRADGDSERYLSVIRGLEALPGNPSFVAVHDGARPLIQPEQIDHCLQAARAHGAAALARRVTETLKKTTSAAFTSGSVSRDELWFMETPQAFRVALLAEAYEKAVSEHAEVTDDVSAAELIGIPSKLIENPLPNLKITVAQDLAVAEALLATQAQPDAD